MKKLSNLKGVKALNRAEQKVINGGDDPFIGSGCNTTCPPVLGIECGVYPNSECVPCTDGPISGFECRIY